jgi:hypothetical protein
MNKDILEAGYGEKDEYENRRIFIHTPRLDVSKDKFSINL